MSVKETAQKHKWWIKDRKLAIVKDSNTTDVNYISPDAVHTVQYHYTKQDEDFGEDNGVSTFTAQATPGDWGVPTYAETINVAPHLINGKGTGLLCSYYLSGQNPIFTVTTPGIGYAVGDTVSFKDPAQDGTGIVLTIATLTVPTGEIGLTESPSIPEDYHEALTYFVIARGYERKPELLNNAVYFRNLWQQELIKAKKDANKEKDGTSYFIQGHDF